MLIKGAVMWTDWTHWFQQGVVTAIRTSYSVRQLNFHRSGSRDWNTISIYFSPSEYMFLKFCCVMCYKFWKENKIPMIDLVGYPWTQSPRSNQQRGRWFLRMKSFAERWKKFNVCLAPYAKKGPKYRWWHPGTVGWMKKWPNKQFTKNLAKKRQQGSPHMPYVCRTNKQNQQSTGFLQAQKR